MRKPYTDDLTDAEWAIIAPHLEREEVRGRKPKYPVREIINAIYYVLRTGCSWRNLPHDFPRWQSVFTRFRRFRDAGVFEKLHLRLLALERVFSGRNLKVSGAIADSQSVKTTQGDAKIPLENLVIYPIEANVRLITYIGEVHYDTAQRANRSSLWVRFDNAWQLRFHQGTPI